MGNCGFISSFLSRSQSLHGLDNDRILGIRGAAIIYDAKKQEIVVNQHRARAPLQDGKQRLAVFVDRTALEVFASGGLTYVPMPFVPKTEDQSVAVSVHGGKAKMMSFQVYKLKSCWDRDR